MDSTGLIGAPLIADARRIVFRNPEPAALRDLLGMLARVDQAHILMLIQCRIISAPAGRGALRAIEELAAADFADVVSREPVRGLYMAYESALIGRCPAAADIHVARSRNDINATLFALRCRRSVAELVQETLRVVASLDKAIARDGAIEMPVFSHRRPGMPGTWELYLSAVAAAILRGAQSLLSALDQFDTSPLGAGAGAGSALPIDPARTAAYLGFTKCASNALDAVASRDAGLRAIAAAAIMTSSLGRMASDLQGWFAEHDAITLPDELVGASSVMPQKRNAFLLEHVLGKAGRTSGALTSALCACHGAPFANAVQIGTEAATAILDGLMLAHDAATLAALTIDGARPVRERFGEMNRSGAVAATSLALELRDRQNVGFRDAHRQVGEVLRAAGRDDPVRDAAIALGLDAAPIDAAASMSHGGGAGCASAALRRDERETAMRAWRAALAKHRRRWRQSDLRLDRAIAAFLDKSSDLP